MLRRFFTLRNTLCFTLAAAASAVLIFSVCGSDNPASPPPSTTPVMGACTNNGMCEHTEQSFCNGSFEPEKSCPPIVRGSCTVGSVCENDFTESQCNALSGSVFAVNTTCPVVQTGSCTFTSGTCQSSTTKTFCDANNGEFLADATCPVVNDPEGACTVGNACYEIKQSGCTDIGGSFAEGGECQIAGVTGSCTTNGVCENDIPQSTCTNPSVFLANATCPDPTGACTAGGTCQDDTPQSTCNALTGSSFVPGGTCVVRGSCTVGNTCQDDVSQAMCGGNFEAGGTCPEIVRGACTLANGSCSPNIEQSVCNGVSGTTFIANGTCPTGSCTLSGGACEEGVLQVDCFGTFRVGESCAGNTVTGSCTRDGVCSNGVAQVNCAGGIFVENGVCSANPTGSCTSLGVCRENILQSSCVDGDFVIGGTCVTYYCPTACTAETGPSRPSNCFQTQALCLSASANHAYCCWASTGECVPINPTATWENAILSDAGCIERSGMPSNTNTPPPIIGYCGWTPGDPTSCWAVAQGQMADPPNQNVTMQAHCQRDGYWFSVAEYGTVAQAKTTCEERMATTTANYCDYGFGNIVQASSCDQWSAQTTSPSTPAASGFYCDFGQPSGTERGGCFFKPSGEVNNQPCQEWETMCTDGSRGRCEAWAREVSMQACIASNTLNPNFQYPCDPGYDGSNPVWNCP